ncbi:uncharacterized protein LOC107266083 isoform X2 [Cephus cinctus]|uniref:Uncharacterized protein LOC107266083 isoform X2 n=1 Tax=Cephus cinctus TaxID=211228 RepID=A0AAJ7BQD5_CEPCN|nr:uncharacterized protein LOC107266083 isoform X2 [Cephus cinctus]
MAYVNVAEWKTDQVCEWLKGLDNSVLPYVHSFTNHGVNGQQLLSLRPEDLEHLGVLKLGHQEIILEAVEYLRNFHYELDRENLQLLALRLSCQAHSLHNELSRQTDSKPVMTQTLSDVASVMTAVKPLVRWLDRPPFSGQLEYNDKKAELLKLSLEMATCAQRDRFAEKPIEEIRTTCGELAKLADYIIQDISDPMILQPASLDLATLKKRPGDDLGFHILPSFHGAHQIAEIKFGSAAHQCGKMEEGDEIVQVNYQTVVGWERKSLLELFRESPAEILLTLKRRPRHTKVYGQIYIKPYRLPSNKKTPYTTRWQQNLPSPRPELLTIPDFTMPLPRHAPKDPSPEPASILDSVNMLDTMATDSSDSDSEVEPPSSVRLYSAKPRNLVQRRATITGASPTTKHGVDLEQFWRELKQEHSTTFQLRDKAASCAHGLDTVPSNLRPQTCLGIEQTKRKKKLEGQVDERRVQFQDRSADIENTHGDESGKQDKDSKQGDKPKLDNQKSVSFDSSTVYCQSSLMDIEINLSNNANASEQTVPSEFRHDTSNTADDKVTKSNEPSTHHKERGKLDKSYSTPAYDLTENEFVERKLATIESHSKLSLASSGSRNASSTSLNKTETRSSEGYLENENKIVDDNKEVEGDDIADLGSVGNVAQKISNIEKSIRCVDTDGKSYSPKVPERMDLVKNVVHIKINDIDYRSSIDENQSDIEYIQSHFDNVHNDSERVDDCHVDSKTNDNAIRNREKNHQSSVVIDSIESSRESSEEKSESTGSYNEHTSGSEGDTTIKKFGEILESINYALIEHTRLRQSTRSLNSQCSDSSSRIIDNVQTTSQSCQYGETPKLEQPKKPEVKPRLTPPEPPPRKYFSKPAPLNLSSISNCSETQERPRVPERPCIRRDLKKSDSIVDSHTKTETLDSQKKPERIESYHDFIEKSTDFIDEPSTPVNDHKPTLLTDPEGYSEIYEGQFKEEKTMYDKYEPYAEKFASPSHSVIDQYRVEHLSRNIDSPDGAGCSRQAHTPDLKPRTLEKDKSSEKGVVNRAMMVARSIGLHGSSSKSSGSSPRSSRKRNMLLAKRRNVSVKDVGVGDLEGWLTYRSRGAGGAWAKAWFVLKGSSLYRFKLQDSAKADCLIALTGYTASQAAEVKSRKYAFKVYHTGTVFYFAADAEDSLAVWLDAINKATLGQDSHGQTSGLFSETDESDNESKTKGKTAQASESKSSGEKSFGSLKKSGKKDAGFKDHEMTGASLDRKYLRFLGTRNQNVPVPTAQFRSYRRVLPTRTPTRKQDSIPNSPDLQVTVAGSTFYGLSSSHSATDVLSSHDMGDYRRTTDRSHSSRSRRPDDLQGFITLEEFMLSHQEEDRRQGLGSRSVSPYVTPLSSDHVHVQHRNFDDSVAVYGHDIHYDDISPNNGVIYGQTRNWDDTSSTSSGASYGLSRHIDDNHLQNHQNADTSHGKSRQVIYGNRKPEVNSIQKIRSQEGVVYYPNRHNDPSHGQNLSNDMIQTQSQSNSPYHSRQDIVQGQNRQMEMIYGRNAQIYGTRAPIRNDLDYGRRSNECYQTRSSDISDTIVGQHPVPRRLIRNDGYSGSSGDLASHTTSETLQRARKEASVTRKGSFNLIDRCRDRASPDKHWMDSLRRTDKKHSSFDKNRLKNVAQYQPPPIPSSPFEQDGMRPAFEMHLDKSEHVQKTNRLKSLFGSKSPQKPSTLDLPKESPKTLLGSPRLHRALFRDKRSSQQQQQQHQQASRSGSQSPGDSGISQSLSSFSGASQSQTLSQSFSSASSVSDWSPDTPTSNVPKCTMGHPACQKRLSNSNRNSLAPPTLPYIPPPTSPPPDYPGLEYPPVFEPGTYSLSDASLLRNRSKNIQHKSEQ